MMQPGAFIMGDLKVLGWAIHRGVKVDISLNTFKKISDKHFSGLNLDKNRKFYVVQENSTTRTGKTLKEDLKPMMEELFGLFLKASGKDNYYQGNWSIFKNTGTSSLGQPDHCDYPRAHDKTESIESPAYDY